MIIVLLILAIAPPVGFLAYLLYMDRQEPEPIGYILVVLLIGMVAVLPAALAEMALSALLPGVAGDPIAVSFLQIGPVEEGIKLAAVMLFVWRNANFNEENDGIVYLGTVSLGFALAENVMYVLQGGLGTGLLRALTAIPLHTFCGVIMGYFVGLARFAPSAASRNMKIAIGLALAILIHGLYDSFALAGSAASAMIFPVVIALVIAGVKFVSRGRALSLKRWIVDREPDDTGAVPFTAVETRPIPVRRPSRWKAVVSRVIFALNFLFWMLLAMGYASRAKKEDIGLLETIVGGLILTIIPLTIAVLLEVSYQRGKRGQAS